jgi:hypothetical protein
MITENRTHKRVCLQGSAVITDEFRICETDILNISYKGIALDHVFNGMMKNLISNFAAVVSSDKFNVKVKLKPKWFKKGALYSAVGFEIVSPYGNWQQFIRNTVYHPPEPEANPTDPWGKVRVKNFHRN